MVDYYWQKGNIWDDNRENENSFWDEVINDYEVELMNVESHIKYHSEDKEIVVKTNTGIFNFNNFGELTERFLKLDVTLISENNDIIYIESL